MLIIGSIALKHHGFLQEGRKPNDIDIISSFSDFKEFCNRTPHKTVYPIHEGKKFVLVDNNDIIHEFEIAWEGSSGADLLDILDCNDDTTTYATPEVCYALKMSHRFLKNSPFFEKTKDDITYLRGLGLTIPTYLEDWMKKREDETYYYKHPSLKQSKDNFFNGDGVIYLFDHDSIHEAVKIVDKPAYTFFKPEDEDVFCSKEMFDNLDEDLKLYSVIEESCVLAIERCLLHYDDVTPQQAFKMALQKVCTSITSGWWRDYAWEHYGQALDNVDYGYWDRFKGEVDKGNVLPYTGSAY